MGLFFVMPSTIDLCPAKLDFKMVYCAIILRINRFLLIHHSEMTTNLYEAHPPRPETGTGTGGARFLEYRSEHSGIFLKDGVTFSCKKKNISI